MSVFELWGHTHAATAVASSSYRQYRRSLKNIFASRFLWLERRYFEHQRTQSRRCEIVRTFFAGTVFTFATAAVVPRLRLWVFQSCFSICRSACIAGSPVSRCGLAVRR